MNPEKANRWIFIGAAALAVLTGVLIFAALVGTGTGDDKERVAASGNIDVLVATQDIKANTRLNEDMFRTATFADEDVVAGAVSDRKAVVGQVARVDILKNDQLSSSKLGVSTENAEDAGIAIALPEGHRAVAVAVNEQTAVGGFIQPGNRVDVIVEFQEKAQNSDQKFMVVRTVLQNALVMARAQDPVQPVVTVGDDGKAVPPGEDDLTTPDDIDKSNAAAGTVTLALTPDDVLDLVQADALGNITLTLRPAGENDVRPTEDLRIPIFD
jgi:pilus assembly protein CpaB